MIEINFVEKGQQLPEMRIILPSTSSLAAIFTNVLCVFV
jgi:FERM domain-containing protein 8